MKRRIRTVVSLLLTFIVCGSLMAGCSSATPSNTDSDTDSSGVVSTSTGPEKVLLAVSFGTSYDDSREITIGAVEKALQAEFTDYEIRRAFTSQIIIDVLDERGIQIDNVAEAMDSMVADGVKEVIVQPTHVMEGFEYDDLIKEITPYKSKFTSLKVGSPLLITDADYTKVASILVDETAEYDKEGTAVVFMGHGTEHEADATYGKLQESLTKSGHANYFIGTVEGEHLLETILPDIKATDAKRIVLLPLMIVAGDHANNDMAGDEEDSWKTILEEEGFEVVPVLKGLGQYPGIQKLIVEHAKAATEL